MTKRFLAVTLTVLALHVDPELRALLRTLR